MKKPIQALLASVVLFAFPLHAAVGDVKTTTVNFSEVAAIQDCTAPNSITTFIVDEFTFEFTPAKEDGQSLCYKGFPGTGYSGKIVYFWLGDVKMTSTTTPKVSKATPGDAFKITNNKKSIIKSVKVNVIDAYIYDIPDLASEFFISVNNKQDLVSTDTRENAERSHIFYYQSPVSLENEHYVGITSIEITTEETESVDPPTPPTPPTDEDEFAVTLESITFEEGGAGKSFMNFQMNVQNPGNVDKYLMVVCDPTNSQKEYFRGTFDSSSFHKPKQSPAKVATIETIKGRIPLTNLNKEDDTPIAISVTPLLKTYEHPETLNVPKSTKNGVQSVQAEDNNASTQYYDLNGTQVTHPTPGTAYIQRRGNVTRKVVLR